MEPSNSDRLRDLRHQGTPEEPAQAKPQHRFPPQERAKEGAGPSVSTQTEPSKSSSRRPRVILVAVAVVGALVVTSLLVVLVQRSPDSTVATVADSEAADDLVPATGPDDDSIFDRPSNVSGLIEQVTNSTVVIVCEPVEDFGSGFVFNLRELAGFSERVVVTNHHVVAGCLDSGQVDVYQGDYYYAGEVEGWDQASDLAVVSVPNLVAPALEPNFDPQIGQWVMAMGAPEGVENSASFGFVTNILNDEPTITSDAVIAGGSSGGPLVDNQGRVIAVNYAVWEEATGISLSAPIAALCLRAVECS